MMSHPAGLSIVLRQDGAWFVSDLSLSAPVTTDIEGVLALLGARPAALAVMSGPAHGARVPVDIGGEDRYVPHGAICGAVAGSFVVIEDASGGAVLLDDLALRVIDRLDGNATTAELAASLRVDPAEVSRRLGTLAAASRVRRCVAVLGNVDVVARAERSSVPSLALVDGAVPAPAGHESEVDRVPVYAFWHEDTGPLLSLGMLSAAARAWRDGALNTCFEIRRPETATQVIDHLRGRKGPAVLLCSDYVWSIEANVALARQAKSLCPELVVLHGGPSSPKYDGDIGEFFARYGDVADVLFRGEGEVALCEFLDGFARTGFDLERWSGESPDAVDGISFVRDGRVVRTRDRERLAVLDDVPSPYLTGEFDHIPAEAWPVGVFFETNRGCPYGCTFCDWGSATMARLRKFPVDRIEAELRWAAERGAYAVQFCDANFGILERDVEISRRLATIREELGFPVVAAFTPAKSTVRHLTKIFDVLLDAGFSLNAAISLQTTDEGVLEAVRRSNISTDTYLSLAADLRRRGLPLVGDLILGLPAQTFDTYKSDLQFFLDHEISARSWSLQVLPNAPMNDPDYREEFGLVVGDDNLIVSTADADEADRSRMLRYRNVVIVSERLGLLRHVMRYLQWDLGIPATDVMERVLDVIEDEPERFPVLAWTFKYFDIHPTVAVGWSAFYEQVRQFLVEEFEGVDDDGRLRCVLELQRFLMPWPGRLFPSEITLAHDYLSYYRSATQSLFTTGLAGEPERPLGEYGPAVFTVTGDPLGLCDSGLSFRGSGRDETMLSDFHVGAATANELESPLMARLPATLEGGFNYEPPTPAEHFSDDDATLEELSASTTRSIPVAIGRPRVVAGAGE